MVASRDRHTGNGQNRLLNKEQLEVMREKYAGTSMDELIAIFGLTAVQIRAIGNGMRLKRTFNSAENRIVEDKLILILCKEYEGISIIALAKKAGMTENQVQTAMQRMKVDGVVYFERAMHHTAWKLSNPPMRPYPLQQIWRNVVQPEAMAA